VSTDRPDRPGVAALVAELEVRRHARTALVVGVGVALAVFVLFAYLPGTEGSILYWAGLAFVLASAVFGVIATVLVGREAYRRTLAVNGIEPGRRSPTTLAVVFGLAGWVLVPVAATLAVDAPGPGFRLAVALSTGGFVVLVVGGLGLKLVGALSLTHAWRPPEAVAGAVVYTALLAAPAVGCPSGGPCLGTPDGRPRGRPVDGAVPAGPPGWSRRTRHRRRPRGPRLRERRDDRQRVIRIPVTRFGSGIEGRAFRGPIRPSCGRTAVTNHDSPYEARPEGDPTGK
jgi:hypothetical protein